MAAAVTLVVRFATLWFAVIVGLLVLLGFMRRWNLGRRLWGKIDMKAGQADSPESVDAAEDSL